ncbi:GAF domain-like protein [Aureobasidium sp. EXF-12298]|nr:GAF domain-like protein [Aureobasidium sp. EXF-12298]KAI4756938.1 GAF domain-like protein [Aureobasidium sp. EXF-12344]
MVHADASNFVSNVSKQEAYTQVLEQARGLFYEQRNWVSPFHVPRTLFLESDIRNNLSNAASLLWHALHALPAPSSNTNWAGFYVLDPSSPSNQLILGPFQGKVACQIIRFGRGVCGTAASTKTTQLVADVEEFPGHIACDAESASEIVVPILQDGKVVAIIDIDCAVKNGFDDEDKKYLEELAELIAESCDF